jgi:hypothetical protein
VAGSGVSLSSNEDTVTIQSTGGGTSSLVSFSLANNISTLTNISGLSFNPSSFLSFGIEYTIVRSTSTQRVCSIGRLSGVYNSASSSWALVEDYAGDNVGIDFSITSSGQVQYKSSNLSGTSYVGVLKYITLITYEI